MTNATTFHNGQKIFIEGNDDAGYMFSVLLANGSGSGLVMAYDTRDIAITEARKWVDRYIADAVPKMTLGTRVVDPYGNVGTIIDHADGDEWIGVDFGDKYGYLHCPFLTLGLATSEPQPVIDVVKAKDAEIERCHRLLVEVHKLAAHTKNERFFESTLQQIASMIHEALTGEQATANGNE